ncbi:serine hydrolase domain-containing protein [Kineobactrum salinum]|uniref:Beta-lactamase family protein n=1 Tax=Kineobactrum salinum TaxID=2708301 RepID=A0A6C0U2E4_9GAMM|nr:serine hydrolase domain-containing protein [Kineobactrum salinum]QIB64535.1 beta-lactamase family protein [Kineobactrum salinum]
MKIPELRLTGLACWLLLLLSLPVTASDSLVHQNLPAAPQPLDPVPLDDSGELAAFLDGAMGAQLQSLDIAGGAVVVVQNGEILQARGYGHADLEQGVPVDPATTLFKPGSVSKLITWTAVMQLVEQGRLELDVDVNRYLTALQLPETFAEPVTLRNLMTHSAGFEDGWAGFLIRRTETDLQPLAQSLAAHRPTRVRAPARNFADGSGVAYSNWGTALAGLIVAEVSGQSFDDYVEQHIFAPLGMDNSSFREPLPAALRARLARGHRDGGSGMEAQPEEFLANVAPAGALSSTAIDMAKFMLAHLQQGEYRGQRILQPATAALMHSRTLSPDPHLNGIALGFYETWINGRRTIGHGGSTLNFMSELMLVPEAGVGLFVTFNSPPGGRAHAALKHAFMDRYFPAVLPSVASIEGFEERAGDYAGAYRGLRRSYTTLEKLYSAFGDIKVQVMPDRSLLVAGLMGDSKRWLEISPGVFRERHGDEMIAFQRDPREQVTALLGPFAATPAVRIAFWETGSFHMALLGLCLLLFLSMLIGTCCGRPAAFPLPPRYRLGRQILAGASGVAVVFLLAVGVLVGLGESAMLDGPPGWFRVALGLPLLLVPLTLVALWLLTQAWREGWGSVRSRLHHSLVAAALALCLWSLHYWNLLGFHLG